MLARLHFRNLILDIECFRIPSLNVYLWLKGYQSITSEICDRFLRGAEYIFAFQF